MHIFSAPALKNCEPKNMWQKQTTDIFCDFSSGATKNPWSFQNGAAFETNFRTVSCRPPNHSPRIGTSADGIEANQGSIFQRPMVRWDQYDAIAPKNNQSHWIQEDSWIHLFVCVFCSSIKSNTICTWSLILLLIKYTGKYWSKSANVFEYQAITLQHARTWKLLVAAQHLRIDAVIATEMWT